MFSSVGLLSAYWRSPAPRFTCGTGRVRVRVKVRVSDTGACRNGACRNSACRNGDLYPFGSGTDFCLIPSCCFSVDGPTTSSQLSSSSLSVLLLLLLVCVSFTIIGPYCHHVIHAEVFDHNQNRVHLEMERAAV